MGVSKDYLYQVFCKKQSDGDEFLIGLLKTILDNQINEIIEKRQKEKRQENKLKEGKTKTGISEKLFLPRKGFRFGNLEMIDNVPVIMIKKAGEDVKDYLTLQELGKMLYKKDLAAVIFDDGELLVFRPDKHF